MTTYNAPSRSTPETHQRGNDKLSRIPVKIKPSETMLRKPSWIRAKIPAGKRITEIKKILREGELSSVCEEANCPNLGECFNKGTATFMIMGDICTRRCPFCDVAHGKPKALDLNEPENLALSIAKMKLKYVVITSVDRDDLRDGGAQHYADCIKAIRQHSPETVIEILAPDFRGRLEKALDAFVGAEPDVFNHNLETVPRLYREARPGADYIWSLELLQKFKQRFPQVKTKSGLMLGLGEDNDEIEAVMQDMRQYDVDMLTLGQYLQPSRDHIALKRYVTPEQFDAFAVSGNTMGFSNVASGPMVRSSYHADLQAHAVLEKDNA